MTRSRVNLSIFLIFAIVSAAGAESADVSIELVDRQVFFPDSDIQVRTTISNNSHEPYRFKLADRRLFSVDFDVRTLDNLRVERAGEFTMRRAADQAQFYREITLEPGEEYRFTERLDRYYRIPGPGIYIVTGEFYPELISRSDAESVTTNRLTLSVRPSPAGVPEVEARIAEDTREILRRREIPPDEVVSGTIRARQQEHWNRFFLYLDIEGLLRTDPQRERQYTRLSEAGRREEREEFRTQLQQQQIEEDIVTRPDDFAILETRYTQSEATVITEQRFGFPGFTEVKEYTYRLERRNDVWIIYDYTVENLGTE